MMTPEQLIEAARGMARPCLRLSAIRGAGKPVAWWGASKTRASADGFEHLLMLDLMGINAERFGLPTTGSARLLLSPSGQTGRFEIDSTRASASGLRAAQRCLHDLTNPYTGEPMGRKYSWRDLASDVVPLWPYEDASLPWTRDLFRRGPKRVLDWMQSLGWRPEWDYNGNFRGAQVVEVYERHYLELHWGTAIDSLLCLGRDETFAVLGGWPFPIDGEGDPEGDLVLTALACTEPQVEVWRSLDGGSYNVLTRIT